MRDYRLILFSLFFIPSVLWGTNGYGQTTDSLRNGTVKGVVTDSIYNFVLPATTVAVFRDSDSSIVKFTVPDEKGVFNISNLPVETPLHLILSHIGYKPVVKHFSISKHQPVKDFEKIEMIQELEGKDATLDEVVVKARVPMRMNRDTIEFIADAFKLDSSSTVEDLIRTLPGFTIWGDGEITFNGKKINAVLLNGKPFLGGKDITLLTQNFPKNTVDRIQVYKQVNQLNPFDSTLEANVKLKDDKKRGHFGKIAAGYGTADRYTGSATFNRYDSKLQLSLTGGANNVNRMASSTDMLIRNSSYKEDGMNIELQPNFSLKGENRPINAGSKLQYVFLDQPTQLKTAILTNDIFVNSNVSGIKEVSNRKIFLTPDTILTQISENDNRLKTVESDISIQLNKRSEFNSLGVGLLVNQNRSTRSLSSTSDQIKTDVGDVSFSRAINNEQKDTRSIRLNIDYINQSPFKSRFSKNIIASYSIWANQSKGNSKSRVEFSDFIQNRIDVFDREYLKKNRSTFGQELQFYYPDLKRLILNRVKLAGIEIGLTNTLVLEGKITSNQVVDKSPSGEYFPNVYLSNHTDASLLKITPGVEISRIFSKELTNRFSKRIKIAANYQNEYYRLNHIATNDIQDFSYWSSRPTPKGTVEYNNHQFGIYEVNYLLTYTTHLNYPDVNQIAPLVDSTDYWNRTFGNRKLTPEYTKELSLRYTFITRKKRNPLNINLQTTLVQTNDKISDSIYIDKSGARSLYYVNIDRVKALNTVSSIKKSQAVGGSTLEFDTRCQIYIDKGQQYLNGLLITSNDRSDNFSIGILLRKKDLFSFKGELGRDSYRSTHKWEGGSEFKSINTYSRLICALKLAKNIHFRSNISLNQSYGNNLTRISYSIWNANLSLRCLKGNKGEIRIDGLDILGQNKGIENKTTGNSQLFSTRNVLKRYYMITFAFYPRRFGEK